MVRKESNVVTVDWLRQIENLQTTCTAMELWPYQAFPRQTRESDTYCPPWEASLPPITAPRGPAIPPLSACRSQDIWACDPGSANQTVLHPILRGCLKAWGRQRSLMALVGWRLLGVRTSAQEQKFTLRGSLPWHDFGGTFSYLAFLKS